MVAKHNTESVRFKTGGEHRVVGFEITSSVVLRNSNLLPIPAKNHLDY